MTAKTDPRELAKRVQRMRDVATAWMSRQAIGDAVLILLRDRELTRETLLEQLRQMAEHRVPEWQGVPEVARKAMDFIADPPDELPAADAMTKS